MPGARSQRAFRVQYPEVGSPNVRLNTSACSSDTIARVARSRCLITAWALAGERTVRSVLSVPRGGLLPQICGDLDSIGL